MITRALLLNVCNVYVFEPLGPRRIISFDNDPHPHPGRPQSPAEYRLDRPGNRARGSRFFCSRSSLLSCVSKTCGAKHSITRLTPSLNSQSHARGPASERAHTLGLRELGCVCGRRLVMGRCVCCRLLDNGTHAWCGHVPLSWSSRLISLRWPRVSGCIRAPRYFSPHTHTPLP